MRVDASSPTLLLPADDTALIEAVRLLQAGQPVAVPTETVYGLAADATNGEAVARIYAAKGRPSFNPLIVHAADMAMAQELAELPPLALRLAEAFWPGPLTLVLPRRVGSPVAEIVTAGLPTVALRLSAHPVMQALIRQAGAPLAAPSANRSGAISPTTAAHVLASLGGHIPLILDGGPCTAGLESTIIGVEKDQLRLLRPGPIDAEAVEAVADVQLLMRHEGADITAPGQLASHYAPTKPLMLNVVNPADDQFMIGFGPVLGQISLSLQGDLIDAAATLFSALHAGDASNYPRIAVAPVPDVNVGTAINDRLKRAAS
jgi:L-threonylcarbamoyladenylate synthase